MINNRVTIAIAAIIVVAIFVAVFLMTQPKAPEPTSIAPLPVAQPKITQPEPIEQSSSITNTRPDVAETTAPEAPAKPVFVPPPLNQSDAPIKQALQQNAELATIAPWLTDEEIVRKSIAAVDNLAKGVVVAKYRPLGFSNGTLVVEQRGDELWLSQDNFARYNFVVDTLTSVQPDTLVTLIDQYQPIIEQAFNELGYKDKTFVGQLNSALDQIIAAPIITTDVQLVRPSVYYKYADPTIEKLPSIQRLMIRMGPENSAKLQQFAIALKSQL